MTFRLFRSSGIGPARKQLVKTATALLTICMLTSQVGCSTNTALPQPSTGLLKPSPPIGYQQLDKGLSLTYVYCERCLQPTRKILWTPDAPASEVNAAVGSSTPTPRPASMAVKATEPKQPSEVITNATVHFKSNSSTLTDQAQDELRQFCDQPMALDGITVTGFTDATGTKARNQELARQRAEQAGIFLKRCTPKQNGMSVPVHEVSKGSCCYVATNSSPAGRQRNRRAEISADLKRAQTTDHTKTSEQPVPRAQQDSQPQTAANTDKAGTALSATNTASHD